MRYSLAVMTLLLAGCNSGEVRVPRHPVTGSIRVDDQPAGDVEIRLHPTDKLGDPDALRPFATSKADGTITLGTYYAGDGAPVGTYKVTLYWPEDPKSTGHSRDLLGGLYGDPNKSTIEVTIKEGTNTLDTIKGNKPKLPPAPVKPKVPADNDGIG